MGATLSMLSTWVTLLLLILGIRSPRGADSNPTVVYPPRSVDNLVNLPCYFLWLRSILMINSLLICSCMKLIWHGKLGARGRH